MTRNYTESIHVELAKRLYKAGMPIETSADDEWWCPPFAEVFDFLMEKEIGVSLFSFFDGRQFVWDWSIDTPKYSDSREGYETFELAATAAIEKALEILNQK